MDAVIHAPISFILAVLVSITVILSNLALAMLNLGRTRALQRQLELRDKEMELRAQRTAQGAQHLELRQAEQLIQQRRLAENNLRIAASAELIYHHSDAAAAADDPHAHGAAMPHAHAQAASQVGPAADPFVVAEFELQNIGDGPVDILACMVAGRGFSNARVKGLGAQGRDVEWDDLVAYYWNGMEETFGHPYEETAPLPAAVPRLFRGISTTKNVPYSVEQLIRMAPREGEVLNRIDAVRDPAALYRLGHVNLVYKIFTVILGYPLAVINQQIGIDANGADMPDEMTNLYSLDLARPVYRRWARVQRAIETINRFPFRLALEQCEIEERQWGKYHSHDPLGLLATPDAWRCFLLHHWDFDEFPGAAPDALAPDPFGAERRARGNVAQVRQVREEIQQRFQVYDPTNTTEEKLQLARKHCRERLDLLVRAWQALNKTIAYCQSPGQGFGRLISSPYADIPHSLDMERWNALAREGYLLTNVPGATPPSSGPIGGSDPLALERYTMRTKYVLVTMRAPGHASGRASILG